MSIENPDIIDGLGINKISGAAVLTISDHLEWNDQHIEALESKLASYIKFIESGQLSLNLKDASEKNAEIQLICKYRPTAEAQAFLAAAREAVVARGVGFSYGPLPDSGYSGDDG